MAPILNLALTEQSFECSASASRHLSGHVGNCVNAIHVLQIHIRIYAQSQLSSLSQSYCSIIHSRLCRQPYPALPEIPGFFQ